MNVEGKIMVANYVVVERPLGGEGSLGNMVQIQEYRY